MLNEKRGASLVISWVLLLGLAIGLGMAVFSWSKIQTEKQLESTINYVEGSMDCEQVSIGASIVVRCLNNEMRWVNVTNTGKLKIDAIVLRSLDAGKEAKYLVEPPKYNFPLMPFSQSSIMGVYYLVGTGVGIGTLEIIPLIKKENTYFACNEKKLVVQCE